MGNNSSGNGMGRGKYNLSTALAEIETQIRSLMLAREGLMNAGFMVETVRTPSTTTHTPPATYRKKTKKRAHRTANGQGPATFTRAVMAESRIPMDTKTVLARVLEKGWVPNTKAKATPEAMVYQTLAWLVRKGEVSRVGVEWSRS